MGIRRRHRDSQGLVLLCTGLELVYTYRSDVRRVRLRGEDDVWLGHQRP